YSHYNYPCAKLKFIQTIYLLVKACTYNFFSYPYNLLTLIETHIIALLLRICKIFAGIVPCFERMANSIVEQV
ncbi:MAG: hypothetical protein ACR5LB_11635, partial [Wolbachia sp.]